MTPRETLLSLGMKPEEIGNHYSDLYVLKNDISTRFVETYKYRNNVKPFIRNIDHKIWYDIPFAYVEYTNERVELLRKLKG